MSDTGLNVAFLAGMPLGGFVMGVAVGWFIWG
jgi:hypothetical protein